MFLACKWRNDVKFKKVDEQESPKRPQHRLGFLKNKHLQDFVTTKSKKVFEILRLDSKFLNENPRFWSK